MADHPPASRQQYSDLPEVVVPQSDSAPQAILDDTRPADKVYVSSEPSHSPNTAPAGLEPRVAEEKQIVENDVQESVPPVPQRPWWKRRKMIAIAGILLLAIIGLVIGLGVGLTRNKDNNEDSSESTLLPISCNSTVCPQILSATEFDDDFFIFARTKEGRIAVRKGFGLSEEWGILDSAPEEFASQPVSIAWEVEDDDERMDVLTVTSEGNVWGCYKTDGAWSNWKAMGPYAGSQPALCRVGNHRIDAWAIDQESHNISHIYWMGEDTQRWSNSAGAWDTDNESGAAKNAPAAVCHADRNTRSLVWYDRENGTVWHRAWNRNSYTTESRGFDGKFIGDPTLFQSDDDSDRIDFFGVGDDRQIRHFSWTPDGGYSPMSNLGGSFASVPSMVSPSEGVYDVVALGEDGRLRHNQDNGRGWWDQWEALNATSASAPLAVFDGDTVRVLYINQTGGFVSMTVDSADDGTWLSMNEESLGSNFTAGGFGEGDLK